MMVNVKTLGKFLDQPALINKFHKKVPYALLGGAYGYGVVNAVSAPKNEKKKKLIQNFSVLTFTVASALLATKGLKINNKQIFEGLIEHAHLHSHDIEEVLAKTKNATSIKLINKVKNEGILKYSEVKELQQNLKKELGQRDIIKKIIPDSHSHGAFEELKKLSLLGLIPVLGGILGGVVGDVLSRDNWKKKFPDKIKEGTYQYLNNIFLCNVGAGIAMVAMDRLKVKSKPIRFAAMLAGVIGVGLVAGSAIANFIGKKLINPIFNSKNKDEKITLKTINNERHPEALDLSLHIDDIASVGFLSGMKWIGPILPVLYSISGYRAGIGYRNNHNA